MMKLLETAYREVDAEASRSDRAEKSARTALLLGVLTSAAFLIIGILLIAVGGYQHDTVPKFAEVVQGFSRLRGTSYLYVGLLVLTLTPVMRVASMWVVYMKRRERFMMIVSLIVLFLIAVSMFLGIG